MYALKTIKPSIVLLPFVERFIIYEGIFSTPLNKNVIPCNIQNIGFILNGIIRSDSFSSQSPLTRSYVMGQFSKPFNVTCCNNLKVLTIYFKPTGMYQLFGTPMCQFTNHSIDFELVAITEGRCFIEKIFELAAPESQIALIENFLVKMIVRNSSDLSKRIEYASSVIIRENDNIQVKQMANMVNMNERNFERHFIQKVGISPKTFASVVRIKKALEMIESKPKFRLKEITHALKYTDQSHFVHEFKKIAGKTPAAYHSTRTNFENFLFGG